MNKINDNRFNATDENNLASVYELISTYGMEAMCNGPINLDTFQATFFNSAIF